MVKGQAAKRQTTEQQLPTHIEITAQTLIKSETLKGDVTKALLDHIQAQPKPWAKMTEYEQERCIHGCRDIAGKLVHEAVRLTASRGFEHIPVSIGKFSVDAEKGIQSSFAMSRSDENLLAMGRRLGSVVLLIPMDLHDFMGERRPTEPDVVGDLSIPKTGPGAPSHPQAEAQLGRGPKIPPEGDAFPPGPTELAHQAGA